MSVSPASVGARGRLRTSLTRAALGIGLAAVSASAPAQNLVANGEFDLDTATWEIADPSRSDLGWNTADHDACGAASGSAAAVNDAPEPDFGVYFSTCITDITPGAAYSFEVYLRFPSGQAAVGSAATLFQWFDSTLDCDGNFVGNSSGGTPPVDTATTDVWLRTGLDSAVAPAGAHSVRMRVSLLKETANEPLLLRFDGVHVVRGGGILLLEGFEIGSTCRWTSEVPN